MAQEDVRSSTSYLTLVEEFPREPELTQFEKILVAARRAKDLHDHDKIELVHDHFTAAYTALHELRRGMIERIYREEEPPALLDDDSDDGDDDE